MILTHHEEQQILNLVRKFLAKHNLWLCGGEGVYQSEKAMDDAIAVMADIADVVIEAEQIDG